MTDSALHLTNKPQTVYLKDYQAPNYFIEEVELDFDLHEGYAIVKSELRIRHNRHSTNKSRDLILYGEELTLLEISINGTKLSPEDYILTPQNLILHNAPEAFELQTTVKIYPEKNTALSGLYRVQDTYCTQCEAQGFRRITYFLDQPDILSQYSTKITANAKKFPYLLSNGNLVDKGKLDDDRHWAIWKDPFKKPSYLFALVAGDFDLIEDKFTTMSKRDIDLKIYVEKGYGDQAGHAMYSLKEAMRWDENTFGREYDLDVYMIVAIGDFNMGAMENKGLNIFNTKYVLAKPETATDEDYIHILSVVGHEYFHNWSGNRVTCRDWFQLSLKEGLTIFRDQTFTEDLLSKPVMRIQEVSYLRDIQFPEDAGPLSHPVRPDSYIEINNFYTATVYNKGAEVLRMLQTILGKSTFRKGMDLYFARHDGQAVTIEDYVKTMEDVSGVDLQQFRLWYSQAGTPVVNVSDDYDPNSKTYTLTITQGYNQNNVLHRDNKPLLIPIRMGLLDKAGNSIALHLNDEPVSDEKVLILRQAAQTFKFNNVSEQPVPSLLRNFSAPVKLNYINAHANSEFLFKHDKDPFNRWEAGQQYALNVILNLIKDYQQDRPLSLPKGMASIFEYILNHDKDKFLLAEELMLPTEKYIGEQLKVVDVDAIHNVREFVLRELARALDSHFIKTYAENHTEGKYEFSMEAVGRRQLKNRCLYYLSLLPQHHDLVWNQFEKSLKTNMSDTQPAFHCLVNIDSPRRAKAIEKFYDVWRHDALVVDKWLAIQAATKLPSALQDVKRLTHSEAFDIKNPNKVYSLISVFGNRNAINFHARNGEGYAFLREIVAQLDKLNPQVAGRMVKPLTYWQRYDKERQELMRSQLEMLLNDKNISSDLYEIVTKSLEA